MASYLENLETRREKVAAALAELTPGVGLDGPNYNGEHAVQRQQKIESLEATLERLDRLIATELEKTPYTRESRGVT